MTSSDNEKKCPFCAEKIKSAAIKCKHCGSILVSQAEDSMGEPIQNVNQLTVGPDLEVLLILTPVLGAAFLLMSSLGGYFFSIISAPIPYLVVLITAVSAAVEIGNKKLDGLSKWHWFFLILLLWIVGFPSYLRLRSKLGLKSLVRVRGVITLVFLAAVVYSIFQQWSLEKSLFEDLRKISKGSEVSEQVSPSPGKPDDVSSTSSSLEKDSSNITYPKIILPVNGSIQVNLGTLSVTREEYEQSKILLNEQTVNGVRDDFIHLEFAYRFEGYDLTLYTTSCSGNGCLWTDFGFIRTNADQTMTVYSSDDWVVDREGVAPQIKITSEGKLEISFEAKSGLKKFYFHDGKFSVD